MKLQTDGIDTMALISGRWVPLALEDMAQMATAVGAHDLGALHAERAVRVPRHRTGQAVEVRRPSAPGLEFVVCFV